MNVLLLPTIPDPDPLAQPAPGWLAWSLLLLTFFLHLLPMNLILGGSILAAVSWARGRKGDRPHHAELARWFAKAAPSAVAAAVTLGVAPLLFLQVLYGRLFFVSSILMGWFWLSVILLVILAYYGCYALAFRGEGLGATQRWVRWLVPVLFAAVAFLYVNNTSLSLRPDVFQDRFLADARGLHLNWDDPTLFPRYLHMLLGAAAVAGMAVAVLGLARRGRDPEFGRWAVRHGNLWFSVSTGLNLVAGVLWLVTLPRETMLRFMGQGAAATIAFVLGLLFALGALAMGLLAIPSAEPRGLVRGAAASLLLTLVSMVVMRDQVRAAALEAAGFQANPWVAPQWGPIAIFALLLVAALVLVAWMVAALAKGKPGPG